jgi:hypothetical protein
MDRVLVPLYTKVTSNMFNQPQQNAEVALGEVWEAVFGNSTVVWGLNCTPTSPGSMAVVLGRGGVTSLQTVDSSAPGSGSTNGNSIVKNGSLHAPATISMAAPGTTGQSINYLIEVTYADTDTNSIDLDYIDPVSLNSYTGNVAVNTSRLDVCSVQVKAGTAATTGTQTTPAVDAGWTGVWVVTVNAGETSILANNIAQAANVPWAQNTFVNQSQIAAYLTQAAAANTYVALSQLATGSTDYSVAQRDSAGGLTATAFNGPASTAAWSNVAAYASNAGVAAVAVTANYAAQAGNATTATTAYTANTAETAIYATSAGSTALSNNSLLLGGYAADVNATISTIVQRDAGGNIYASTLNGLATSAEFGDLGERFHASEPLEEGDVVAIGGINEIKKATTDDVFGVITAQPAVRMNEMAGEDVSEWPFVCWAGRIPVKVLGGASKGDYLVVSSIAGVASALSEKPPAGFTIIGRALETKIDIDVVLVMSAVRAVL